MQYGKGAAANLEMVCNWEQLINEVLYGICL